MNRSVLTRLASTALRYALAVIFVYAGAAKAPWPQRFALDIESYRLVGPGVATIVAGYLPYLEIVGGVALVMRRWAAGAVLLLTVLTAVFLVALISAWARGLEIRCGCFGAGDAPGAQYSWWVLRDVSLFIACAFVWTTLPARERDRAI